MTLAAKICGLNDEAAVDAAVAHGADYLGFIIFPKSPRAVSPARAGELARRRGAAKAVAVLVDPSEPLLGEVLREMKPDVIQLHGQESPWRCRDARAYADEVWKAFGVAEAGDLHAAGAYLDTADRFVFDAKPPEGADRPGGWGAAYDWSILKGWASAPWLLSGGLTLDNVAEAVRASGARAVDVASGVERSPGVKDPERIAAFLNAAKSSGALAS